MSKWPSYSGCAWAPRSRGFAALRAACAARAARGDARAPWPWPAWRGSAARARGPHRSTRAIEILTSSEVVPLRLEPTTATDSGMHATYRARAGAARGATSTPSGGAGGRHVPGLGATRIGVHPDRERSARRRRPRADHRRGVRLRRSARGAAGHARAGLGQLRADRSGDRGLAEAVAGNQSETRGRTFVQNCRSNAAECGSESARCSSRRRSTESAAASSAPRAGA